jgi:hypothetical protein
LLNSYTHDHQVSRMVAAISLDHVRDGQ